MAIAEHDPGFDALASARTLGESGVEATQAEAHAEAARMARAGPLTRADLDNFEARLNARNDNFEMRFNERIDNFEARLNARSDNFEMRFNAKIDRLGKRMIRAAIAIVLAQAVLTAILTAGLTLGLLKMFGDAG